MLVCFHVYSLPSLALCFRELHLPGSFVLVFFFFFGGFGQWEALAGGRRGKNQGILLLLQAASLQSLLFSMLPASTGCSFHLGPGSCWTGVALLPVSISSFRYWALIILPLPEALPTERLECLFAVVNAWGAARILCHLRDHLPVFTSLCSHSIEGFSFQLVSDCCAALQLGHREGVGGGARPSGCLGALPLRLPSPQRRLGLAPGLLPLPCVGTVQPSLPGAHGSIFSCRQQLSGWHSRVSGCGDLPSCPCFGQLKLCLGAEAEKTDTDETQGHLI